MKQTDITQIYKCLHQIQSETNTVQSGHEAYIPMDNIRKLAKQSQDIISEYFPGISHFDTIKQYQQIMFAVQLDLERINEFLDKIHSLATTEPTNPVTRHNISVATKTAQNYLKGCIDILNP